MRFLRYLWVKFSTIFLNLFGDYRNTELYKAVLADDYVLVEALLFAGANARFAVANRGPLVPPNTILYDALRYADDIRIAEILYQYGARLIERNEQLKYCVYANNYNAVKFLTERGATLPDYVSQQERFYINCPPDRFDQRIVELLRTELGFNGPFEEIPD